jgi:hypothetical protein
MYEEEQEMIEEELSEEAEELLREDKNYLSEEWKAVQDILNDRIDDDEEDNFYDRGW